MLVTVKAPTKEVPPGGGGVKPFAREINGSHPLAEVPQAGSLHKKTKKKNTVH